MKRNILMLLGLFLIGALQAQENTEGTKNEAKSVRKEIVVIVHPRSPLGEKITADGLKDIYLGKVKFIGKARLRPVNQKDMEIFSKFVEKFLMMSFAEYKHLWVKKVFAEGGSVPTLLDKPENVVQYVSENEGAIGYLWENDLTGAENGIVRLKWNPGRNSLSGRP